jgi:hypothetical protein
MFISLKIDLLLIWEDCEMLDYVSKSLCAVVNAPSLVDFC